MSSSFWYQHGLTNASTYFHQVLVELATFGLGFVFNGHVNEHLSIRDQPRASILSLFISLFCEISDLITAWR